mmetsp:Transcript_38483/g.94660  ORF Transcript_38483/g.94660 Transcript_38483/m.94660 type:complete len:111 (+) Transcript_38483:683-1015(+)
MVALSQALPVVEAFFRKALPSGSMAARLYDGQPLANIIITNRPEAFEPLVSAGQHIDFTLTDTQGNNAAHTAVLCDRHEIIQQIYDIGQHEAFTVRNAQGLTPSDIGGVD